MTHQCLMLLQFIMQIVPTTEISSVLEQQAQQTNILSSVSSILPTASDFTSNSKPKKTNATWVLTNMGVNEFF